MRGHDTQLAGMFSYLSPEEWILVPHPLRPIRQYVDTALTALSPQLEQSSMPANRSALGCPGEDPTGPVAAGALQSLE